MDDLLTAMNYVEGITMRLVTIKMTAEIVVTAWRQGTISEQHIQLLEQACRSTDREIVQCAEQDLC
jgi:hypothetical protein